MSPRGTVPTTRNRRPPCRISRARVPRQRMINKERAMRHWHGILIAGLVAGCTSSPRPPGPSNVPDHFEENLDVITRSVTHPCGGDADIDLDGAVDVHYTYTYDSLGRSKQDLGLDLDGGVYEQIDYDWDNAGHLIRTRVHQPLFAAAFEQTHVYDTLGRRTQFQNV